MRTFDVKFKQKVVRAYLSGKGGYKILAAKFDIADSQVRRWVGAYQHHGSAGLVRQRGRYTCEFKLEVLHRLATENLSCRELAAMYNIGNPHNITMWQRQHERGELRSPQHILPLDDLVPIKKKTSARSPEPEQSEPGRPLTARESTVARGGCVPKKSQCLGSSEKISAAERAQIVLELRREFALADLLHAAQLPRSTFYYQAKVLAMPDRHDELKARIRAVYTEHRGLYGYRRVTAAIRRDGRLVNHKAVQRLMSDMGMKSRVRSKKFRSYRGELGQAAPNSLNHEFTASQANQKWVTDVTEFSVAGKKLYLSPVMDLYNGEIVAYETSRRPDFSLVMNMLKKAARRCRGMDGPLLHSDQGWHYRMQPYRLALARYGIKQSMSRKGNCFDNAAMESFFATLKAEYFYLSAFEDVEQLDAGLKSYIDYYNQRRIKSKLSGMSPVEYRLQAARN